MRDVEISALLLGFYISFFTTPTIIVRKGTRKLIFSPFYCISFTRAFFAMAKYYEVFKTLITASSLIGYYMSSVELIYGRKWYLRNLKFVFYFTAISLPLYFLFSVKYVFYDEGDIGPKMYGIALMFFCFFCAFLAYSFYFNREKFVKLFELWDSLFQEELFPEHRQLLLDKNVRTVNRWLKIFGSASLFTPLLYFTATYFNKDKKLDHPIGIPYRNQSPDFELINTFDLFCGSLGFATLITYDSMTMAFFCLEEAQFRHLKKSLTKIIDIFSVTEQGQILINSSGDVFNDISDNNMERVRKDFAEMEKKMKIWISHHQQLLRFHDELQRLYYFPLSVKFFAFVAICCISGFLLTTGKLPMKDNMLAIGFCCNNYLIFYVNITFADSTGAASATMFGEAFGKSWYIYPKKMRTAFKIIQMRSHRPVQYVAIWIYPINSRTFLKILTSVYSFSTFLLQLDRKNIRSNGK